MSCVRWSLIAFFPSLNSERARVQGNADEREMVFQDVNKDVEEIFETIRDKIEKIESRHAVERVKLLNADKHYHVTRLYPNLSLFDPTIPYQAEIDRTGRYRPDQSPTGTENKYFDESDNEEDDNYNARMDYKTSSWQNLR